MVEINRVYDLNRMPMAGRLIFGLIVIWLGLLFLLDEFNILNATRILRYWPAVLVAYGLMRLTGIFSRRQVTAGLVFTVIGTWMLLKALDVFPYGIGDLWPVVLIGVGILMISGSLRRVRALGGAGGMGGTGGLGGSSGFGGAGAAVGADTISAFAFWSGVDRKVATTDFRGGDLTAIMGGHDIDLRPAKIAGGGTATIDLLVVMGGVDLRVPEDWTVVCDAVPIMGAVEDQTRPPAGEVRGRLVLRGLVLMGGVEVKN